jgi:hypothetical protein
MSITMPPMIDPVTPLQTHSSSEIHSHVQTHTMVEKTIQVIPNAEADTLRSFLLGNVEPGSKVLTDGLASYSLAAGDDYVHRSTSIKGSGMDAHEVLPGVHRVAALVKRWLLGTHQGSFSADHVQAYEPLAKVGRIFLTAPQ